MARLARLVRLACVAQAESADRRATIRPVRMGALAIAAALILVTRAGAQSAPVAPTPAPAPAAPATPAPATSAPAAPAASAPAAARPAVRPSMPDESLPGRGLAQHDFLYCGEWQNRGKSEQIMQIVRGGQVVWSYSIPGQEEYGDCTRLSNGNIIFSRRLSASEVTSDKRIVWHYDAPPKTEIHTTQPLGLDRVLIMQNGDPATLLMIHKASGTVEKRLTLPTRRPENVHGQFRHVRRTTAGTFLVAHLDLGKVAEYDDGGKEIWSVPAPSAWAAVRLKNGHTLISGNQHGYVREVNRAGEIVWAIEKDDLPGIPLYTVQEVTRLANGNTLINNWSGSLPLADWPTVVQLIEVTPDKKVVWALRDWRTLGPASSTHLLDEPGVPEQGEIQR